MSLQKIFIAVHNDFLDDLAEALKQNGLNDFLGRMIGNVTVLIITGKSSQFKNLIFNLQKMKYEKNMPILILNEFGFLS